MSGNEQKTAPEHDHARRDAETQVILGLFVIIVSIPTLIGTFFAHRPHAMVINVIAGLVLLGIGVAFTVYGWRAMRKAR